jgi:starch synthase (maltosyl-transferring)
LTIGDENLVRENLHHRLSLTAKSLRPWPDRPVAIALVITDLDPGGAERAMVALARRLEPRRWRVGVFCLGGEGPLAEVVRQASLSCECLNVRRRQRVRAVVELARALRRFRPELAQSFLFHANIAARLAAPLAGCRWVVGGLRVAEHQKRWHLIIDRLTASLGVGSVCVSEGVLRFSREVAGLDAARLTVIPNGIDPTPFDEAVPVSRAEFGVADDAYMALFVGRLDVQKGLPNLIDAAERVIALRPNWHLVLAGDGPNRGWLLAQIAEKPLLRRNVHWLGRREDIPRLLKSADVLVHASLWEGMPNAVLEAMAARRPVVGTAVEGTEDLVLDGQTGWLVPPRDSAALSRALIEATDSRSSGRCYGEAGRRRLEQEYSLDRTVAAYESLWAGILGFRLASPEPGDPAR